MAFGDEKVVVSVKDIDHGAILYTDNAGAEQTYYPCHGIWVEVQTLEVLTALGYRKEEGQEPPLVTSVRGTVALEDRSISIVGDTKSKARCLTISFDVGDWKPKPVEPTEDDLPMLSNELGGAMLGFNRADWEIGNDDDWWISCYLPKAFIDALVADIRNSQIDGMKVGLRLRGLYTTEHSWAPISSRGDLFIRPDRKDNTITIPDMATGHVSSIGFTSAPRDLCKPEPVAPVEPENEGMLPAPDPVAVAIAALGARVEQMRSTLKWIGGFIVLALFFVASR
ncbi:MAG: hypothetical protein Q7U45_11960 [Burkholderiaceae bacterium]|nr:hypothetical protein [Pseudomonas sp.]MDO9160153.1 hypothetical protein [Burkholderiaceae bacterium]MDZ4194525.1 hypothetical protein [Pseudomonas sp.]